MKSLEMKYGGVEISNKSKNKYYPSFQIQGSAIPELEDKEVGDTCMICLKVKIKSMNADNNGKTIGLEAVAGEYLDKKGKEDDDY